jgi:hypothetical protein
LVAEGNEAAAAHAIHRLTDSSLPDAAAYDLIRELAALQPKSEELRSVPPERENPACRRGFGSQRINQSPIPGREKARAFYTQKAMGTHPRPQALPQVQARLQTDFANRRDLFGLRDQCGTEAEEMSARCRCGRDKNPQYDACLRCERDAETWTAYRLGFERGFHFGCDAARDGLILDQRQQQQVAA